MEVCFEKGGLAMLTVVVELLKVRFALVAEAYRRDRERGALSLELILLAAGLVAAGGLLAGIIYKIVESKGKELEDQIKIK